MIFFGEDFRHLYRFIQMKFNFFGIIGIVVHIVRAVLIHPQYKSR